MAGWHHQCNGHELGQTLGDGEGPAGLVCCSPWGHKESDTMGQVSNITSHWSEWSSLKILQIINTRENTEKREPLHSLWECKVGHSLWKTIWRLLKKLKIELPYDLAITLLWIYPEKNEN